MAVSDEDFETLKSQVDQFFLIVMGIIVYLMQCGFAFLEAGSVRSKNATNILIKNLLDSFVSGIAYWLFGYAFGYGSGNFFIGYEWFAFSGVPEHDYARFFFQYVFAASTATIVSGALAERCEFMAYFVYSFVITGFIYPVATHWAWTGEGWLAAGSVYDLDDDGIAETTVVYQDFAGSGVLHVLGGVASFIGALVVGPRLGRFHAHSDDIHLRGHSVPFAALGGFILLFGFLAFNGGSLGTVTGEHSGAIVSLSVVNTVISGSTSAFVMLAIQKTGLFGNSHWSLLSSMNGALAGMVAICAGCNVYYTWASALIGFIAGIVFKITSWGVEKMKVDDPLDAVAGNTRTLTDTLIVYTLTNALIVCKLTSTLTMYTLTRVVL